MKCHFCGNEVEDGAKFCPVCGTKVASGNDSGNEGAAPQYEDPNGQPGYGYGQPADGQPGYGYGQPIYDYSQPVKQISGTPYLIFSILVTICCCLPLGIVSIVYASKINSLQRMGDYEGAQDAAKKAKIFMIVGAIVGLIASIAMGIFASGDFSDDYDLISSIQSDESYEDADEDHASSGKSKKIESSEKLGDSWRSYTVQINDVVITFPCAIDDVEAAGLTLDTESTPEDYVINKNDYELVFFDDENYHSIMFVVANNTEAAKTVKECTVNGIYVDDYDVRDGDLTIIFPGEIQIGTDIDTVIEKWGEADDVYEGDYSDSYTWYEEDGYNYCSVSVDPETDKVTTIDLDGENLK